MISHYPPVRKTLKAQVIARIDVPRCQQSVRITEHLVDQRSRVHRFELHAIQFALSAGVAYALIVLSGPAFIRGEGDEIAVGRVCALTRRSTQADAVAVYRAAVDL